MLEFVDLDSLEISKDSDVSKELRASYSDLVYRLRPRVSGQGGFRQGASEAGEPVQDAQARKAQAQDALAQHAQALDGQAQHTHARATQAQGSRAQADQHSGGTDQPATSAEPASASTSTSAPDLALCVNMLFEHKSTPE
ncbi:MAG: hypothetical protein GVY22_18255 [Gammaproteobacteria bacterium]|nr:hypothetical protein [Gammaproteobacteria bacterium]